MPRKLVEDAQFRRSAFGQARAASHAGISELMNGMCEGVIDKGGFCDADTFHYAMFGLSQEACLPAARLQRLRMPLPARLERVALLEFASGEPYMRTDAYTNGVNTDIMGLVLPSKSDMGSRVLEYRIAPLYHSSEKYLGEIIINNVEVVTAGRQPEIIPSTRTVLTVKRHDGEFGDSTAESNAYWDHELTVGMMAIRQSFAAQGEERRWSHYDGIVAAMREHVAAVPVAS
jgi:hypothetical protein